MATICTATKADGTPCKAWAIADTDPPRCAAHGGATGKPGAPKGNQNAVKHGFYAGYTAPGVTIDDVLDDLAAKQRALSDYITARLEDPETDVANIAHLFALHAQTASRLGRLLRDRRAITGDAADGIAGAIGQALDELGSILGADL